MKLRAYHYFIFLGIALILAAAVWQFAFSSSDKTLPPLDAQTAAELYNPQSNNIAGNPHGNVTLVEFFDYNCHFCRQFHPQIDALIAKNPNLRVVYKEFLLFGLPSVPATTAALAAHQQGKYFPLQQALLTASKPLTLDEVMRLAKSVGLNTQKLQTDMATIGVKQLQRNDALANTLNINGAPVFIIANSQIALDPQHNLQQPQYIYMGVTADTAKELQRLIVKAGN